MIGLALLSVAVLACLGLFAIVFKRNLIKIVMGITVLSSAANLFLVVLGYRDGAIAPIFTRASKKLSRKRASK